MTTAVAVIEEVRGSLTRMAPQFAAALPKHVTPDRFVRVVVTAVQNNKDLLACDRQTLFSSAMRAAQVGLLPDGREGAIVAFGSTATWLPMVAGIMKLVRNSGEIATWSVHVVHERDQFEYELGDSETITHRPARGDRGTIIGAYSIVTMKSGEKSREHMDIDEIEAIRKRSRTSGKGPWVTDLGEMCKKTVVRRHAKRLPMSTDLESALRDTDALFMPPTPAPEPETLPHAPKARGKRPSSLQAVVDSASTTPVDDAPPPPDDGWGDRV